jgi:hypothetical protein
MYPKQLNTPHQSHKNHSDGRQGKPTWLALACRRHGQVLTNTAMKNLGCADAPYAMISAGHWPVVAVSLPSVQGPAETETQADFGTSSTLNCGLQSLKILKVFGINSELC